MLRFTSRRLISNNRFAPKTPKTVSNMSTSSQPHKKEYGDFKPITWKTLLGTFAVASAGLWYIQQEKKSMQEQRDKAEAERKTMSYGKVAIGGPFELTDAKTGKTVTQETYKGKFMLIYFGFTNCPDICPDELDKMSRAIEKVDNVSVSSEGTLQASAENSVGKSIVPIFISIDPLRDTADAVKKYIEEFSPRFQGLTGTQEQVDAVAKLYRIYISKGDPVDGEVDYLVDHSIFFFLMDPDGEFVEFFGRNATAEDVADKLVKNVKRYALEHPSFQKM